MYKHFAFILTLLLIPGIMESVYTQTNAQKDFQSQISEMETHTINPSNIQQINENHYSWIIKSHPNYEQIVYNANLPIYISSLPIIERDQAKNIILEGSSSEIISLLHGYKNFDIPKIDKGAINLSPKQTFKEGGITNKDVIIDSVNEYIKQNEEIERQKNAHFRKIADVYPDYEEIVFSSDFNNYINNLPAVQRKTAKRVFDSGLAEEIIALISDYRRSLSTDK